MGGDCCSQAPDAPPEMRLEQSPPPPTEVSFCLVRRSSLNLSQTCMGREISHQGLLVSGVFVALCTQSHCKSCCPRLLPSLQSPGVGISQSRQLMLSVHCPDLASRANSGLYLFYKQLLWAYYGPETVLSMRNSDINKTQAFSQSPGNQPAFFNLKKARKQKDWGIQH